MTARYRNTFPRPPSANGLFVNSRRTGGRFPSPQYKAWQKLAGQHFALAPLIRCKGKVRIVYVYGQEHDRRRRDLMNFEKGLTDLLVKAGVMEDDSLIVEALLRWSASVPPGQVMVDVSEVAETVLNAS